jgi:uncharacterized membrane protein
MTPNKELMKQAREVLQGNWGLAIGAFLIYGVVAGAASYAGISIIVGGPLLLGLIIFSLSLSRKKEAKIEQLFEGFKQFGQSLAAYLLVAIFTFLWMLLLIIPGIIAALAYSQTMYIIADDPKIGASDAIKKSKELMRGKKWKYFCLEFRFFWWTLLAILTFGIGFLWLIPYMQISFVKFYEDVKGDATPAVPAPAEAPAAQA